jgi:hypothetical protein
VPLKYLADAKKIAYPIIAPSSLNPCVSTLLLHRALVRVPSLALLQIFVTTEAEAAVPPGKANKTGKNNKNWELSL